MLHELFHHGYTIGSFFKAITVRPPDPYHPAINMLEKIKANLTDVNTSCLSYLDKLQGVRPIVINCPSLATNCESFDQGVMLAAAQIVGV